MTTADLTPDVESVTENPSEIYLLTTQIADAESQQGDTALGYKPVPPLDEINQDAEFVAREITKSEFEAIWEQCRCNTGQRSG